jgi:hypothetical protein
MLRHDIAERLRPQIGKSGVRIPMMPISQSDLMPISSERSDARLPQCELVIGTRQDFSRVRLFFI